MLISDWYILNPTICLMVLPWGVTHLVTDQLVGKRHLWSLWSRTYVQKSRILPPNHWGNPANRDWPATLGFSTTYWGTIKIVQAELNHVSPPNFVNRMSSQLYMYCEFINHRLTWTTKQTMIKVLIPFTTSSGSVASDRSARNPTKTLQIWYL